LCSAHPEFISSTNMKPISRRTVDSIAEIIYSPGDFIFSNSKSFYDIYETDPVPLGAGLHGEIRKCRHRGTDAIRAVKIIKKECKSGIYLEDANVHREVDVFKALDHPSILRMYEFFNSKTEYFLVLEYMDGGDLCDKIASGFHFSEKIIRSIMRQILSGLSYLHKKKLVHRDIKPENIVLASDIKDDEITLKIIDFDLTAKCPQGTRMKQVAGTLEYMAPEIFDRSYNEKFDLWSCGVIMFILFAGFNPFQGKNDTETIRKIRRGRFNIESPRWINVSNDAKDLIRKLLAKDPEQRISAEEACAHPWFKADWKEKESDDDLSNIFNRLRNYQRSSKLTESLSTFILSQVMSYKNFMNIQSAFQSLDLNCDGVISQSELENFTRCFVENSPETAAKEIMSQVDTDENGVIDYYEFLRACIDPKEILCKENLLKALRMLGHGESALVTCGDLKKWLKSDSCLSQECTQEILDELDPVGKECFTPGYCENHRQAGTQHMKIALLA